MTPYYADDWLTVYGGDARTVLAELAADSVQCVVTSPPYWGLRDYGHGEQLGLEATPKQYVANMVGVFREVRRVLRPDGTLWLNLGSSYSGVGAQWGGTNSKETGKRAERMFKRAAAGGSGPSRSRQPERAPAYDTDGTGPLGSSGPGSAYPDLCDGCRAVQSPRTTDTLRPPPVGASPLSPTSRDTEHSGSATAFPGASPLDVPASTTTQSETLPPGPCSHCGNCGACLSVLRSSSRDARACGRNSWLNYPTFKSKDMVPIPWMVAIALQADGWYLRSDIIWAKPNPMPESVTDRPTKSHEYLFLLTRSARYVYDAAAVAEASTGRTDVGKMSFRSSIGAGGVWRDEERTGDVSERNLRTVWTVATAPYPGAHFATFPPKLVEPCIKAGCPDKVCGECGAAWERQVERQKFPRESTAHRGPSGHSIGAGRNDHDLTRSGQEWNRWRAEHPDETTGWKPTCGHDAAPVPGVVLDPFAGTGTVGMVAQQLSRRAVLIDLNPDYLRQQLARNAQTPLGLVS